MSHLRNSAAFIIIFLFSISCSTEDPAECITAFDCDEGFVCIDGYCVDDGIGDTGDSGNTGDTGNSGNTGDSGNSGNTGNSGDTSIPDEDAATVDNETASDAECRYKCNPDYHWETSSCVFNTKTDQPCTGIPSNAEWNTASSITQTWNGTSWVPSTAAVYNETPSSIDCRYKCNADYHFEGSACISNTRIASCTGLPANASWNTASSITQTWNGSAWTPLTAATYNTTGSTTECRYQCSANFYWYNSACVQCYDNAHCNTGAGEICSNNQCTVPIPANSCANGSENRRGCGNARVIGRSIAKTTSGFTMNADTCSASNDHDLPSTDDCWDANADHSYKIYLRAGETAAIQLTTGDPCSYSVSDWDATLKLYTNLTVCNNENKNEYDYCQKYITSMHSKSFTATVDTWLYIIVDGSSAFDDEGDYTLTVKLQNCVTAGCNCP